ncbi:MAG: hypothetical protein ABL985_13985 [Casimicrobium sp.]
MSTERESLAAVAARIIVESELTDWALARRKAAAELGLAAHGAPLPSDAQIISEIKAYHALFGGEAWSAQLRAQREFALEAMRELRAFKPKLVGPVAEGWAHAGSEIRIEVAPDNPKALEYRLIELGVEFEPHQTRDGGTQLEIIDGDWPMRIVVRTPGRASDPRFQLRLNEVQIEQLLASSDS